MALDAVAQVGFPAHAGMDPTSRTMFMSLQRKHRLHSQHVSEEDVAKWPRAQISEELNILEDLEERRGRVPTREELRRLEQLKRRL